MSDMYPSSFQFVQMLQSRQHNLLACLFDLPSQKHLIQYSINLVEVEHQVQLTDVPKELVQYLNEEVYGL